MGSHWVHGGRHPPRCRERSRRRSGQQPRRPYRTRGKSCSWPLRVLSLGLRAVLWVLIDAVLSQADDPANTALSGGRRTEQAGTDRLMDVSYFFWPNALSATASTTVNFDKKARRARRRASL